MTNDGPSQDARGNGDQSVAADEISLFDIWNILVRRRWVLGTIFLLVTAISLAVALTRPPTYRLSQMIEIGQVEFGLIPEMTSLAADIPSAGRSDPGVVNIFFDSESKSPKFEAFDPPKTVATEIENIHIPEALAKLPDSDGQDAPMASSVSAEIIDDTQLVRMTAEVPASQVGGYEKLMSKAADRLIAAHSDVEKSARQRLQGVVTEARNAAAEIRDDLAARRSEMGRLSVKEDLVSTQIEDLTGLLDRTEKARLKAIEGEPNVSQAMSVMLVSNEMRQARQDLSALRERLEIDLPAERAKLQNEVASLERRLKVAEGKVEALKTSANQVTGTRVVAPPQRSGGPTGTPLAVIVALGAILGAVAGVLGAFFVEFVSAARAHRSA